MHGIIFGIDLVRFMTSGDEHIAPVVCLTSYSSKCGEAKGEEGIFYGYHYSYRYVENIKNDKPSSKYFEFLESV